MIIFVGRNKVALLITVRCYTILAGAESQKRVGKRNNYIQNYTALGTYIACNMLIATLCFSSENGASKIHALYLYT